MARSSRALVAIVAVIVVVFIGIGARMVAVDGSAKLAQVGTPAIGGPFTLVDQDGQTVTEQSYAGKYRLMFFGYTFCPDVCPTTLTTAAAAMEKLTPWQRAQVVPIFVTVDPGRDTVPVMKNYVSAFGPGIVGLTGSDEQVAAVAKAFKVYAAKVKSDKPGEYTMDHSAIIYLMGPDNKFLAHFPHGTSADDLAAGIKKQFP